MKNNPQQIILGLGTNLGDRQGSLICAIKNLSRRLGNPVAVSSTIETEPWGFRSDNKFLNATVLFLSDISAEELLTFTQQTERRMGRSKKSHNGNYSDRPIDIDILFYGNEIINTPLLTVPHPLLHKRRFVLEPLCEIAPQLTHPILKKSIRQMLDELLKTEKEP